MSKTKQKAKKNQETKTDLLSLVDSFFIKRGTFIFYLSMALTLFFSFLLFDPKVTAGGDDSAYVIRSYWFLKKFTFPTFQGPLYPIFLSPFIAIFDVNIRPLKVLSLIFIIIHLIFFRKTFKDKVPASVLGVSMIIISTSSAYLYFGYQTYVEAFYLMVQSIALWFFMKYFIDRDNNGFKLKEDYKKYLLLGVTIFVLGITRSVGYAMLGVVLLYFIIEKKWHSVLPTVISFGGIYAVYTFLKKMIWGIGSADFSGQGSGLLYKDYYNESMGKEDLAGFFQRLLDNSNLYLSKHLYIFLGLRDYEPGMKVFPWLTVLTYLLFFTAIILVLKKNKHILFASLYVGVLCFVTFIIIQKSWDQARLVIPYFPIILLSLSSGLYYLLKLKQTRLFQIALPVIFIIIFFKSISVTFNEVNKTSKLKPPYYGLTPDWVNYVKECKWAAQNVPAGKGIACRKPSISFIYSEGREFAGIYKFQMLNTTSVFRQLEDSTYIISDLGSVYNNNIPIGTQMYFRNNISFILSYNNKLTGVFKPGKEQYNEVLAALNNLSVTYSTKPFDYYSENITEPQKSFLVSPDSLLNVFRGRDIEYVIRASLRRYPHVKSEHVINTIHRYLYFIEQKYPGIFEKVHQSGNDNDEPAVLYKINYDLYKLEDNT